MATPSSDSDRRGPDVLGGVREQLLPGLQVNRLRSKVNNLVFGKPKEAVYVGKYVVFDPIGSGGMGTVYAGYDAKLDRKVAVKVIRGERTWTKRVEREAQALAAVDHPNVVQIYDTGDQDGEVYLAMEFVDGPTMAQWVEQQAPPWRDILEMYKQAGRGLAAAHAAGLIHRDFKPQNVLVGADQRVRVLDFGLARGRHDTDAEEPYAPPSPSASASLTLPITRSGAIMGTRAYMSPEQHLGEKVDHRADQFSFCVALYEALYGSRPFPGDTEETLVHAVLAGRVQTPGNDRRVPGWVRRVVLKGLQVERADRHASMDALLEELERDPRITVRRVAMVVAAIAALLVAGLLWQLREERFATEQAQLQVEKEAERAQKLAEQREKEELELEARRRRDALTLLEVRFQMGGDPTHALASLKNLSDDFDGWSTAARILASEAEYIGVASTVLRLPEDEVAQALSPDGKLVVTRNPTSSSVQLFNIETGNIRPLGPAGTMPEVAFSADGSQVAALRVPEGLRVWDLSSMTNRKLGPADDGHFTLQFDTTGAVLAYGRHPEVHRWGTSGPQILAQHEGRVMSLAVHPDGTFAASVDAAGHSRLWDLSTLQWQTLEGSGPVAFSAQGHLAIVDQDANIQLSTPSDPKDPATTLVGPGSAVDVLVFSPGSGRLAAGLADGHIAWWDLSSGDRRDLLAAQDGVESLRFAQDGLLGATSLSNLVLYELNGSPPQVLRGHGGVGFWTVRDNAEVVTVGREGSIRIWSPRTSAARPLPGHRGDVAFAAPGPGGAWITADDAGVIQRWDPDMRAPEVLANSDAGVSALASSPSGTLAWATGANEVRILGRGDAEWKVLSTYPGAVVVLEFSDDHKLAVAGPEGGLQLWDLAAWKPTASWSLQGLTVHSVGFDNRGEGRAIGWTEDEQTFVVRLGRGGREVRDELPSAGLLDAAFSRDGSFIAFSGADRSVSLYDTQTRDVDRLGQHGGLVNGVTISADGATIVSAGDDGEVRLWDVQSGHGRAVPLSDRPLYAVAMSDSGDRFLVLGEGADGSVAFVGHDELPRSADELRAWVAAATDLEVEIEPINWVAQQVAPR